MDSLRRPTRPPNPSGPRRIFHAPSRRPNPHLSTTLSASSLHIPAEEADPKDDMVERDSSGNYNMAAPSTNLNKREVGGMQAGDEDAGTFIFCEQTEVVAFADSVPRPWWVS